MSHPGNDGIIDNKRDNITIHESRIKLIDDMVYVATKMGIGAVQEIAAETLKRKPGMSVKDFVKILDDYIEKQEELKNSH
tara:strand:+ start:100 stop:339 length:240 start_codon:yes stop_codon:yes gene_type:complete